jgi:energy-coupling factor transporter transmembrane protein EcfT
MPVVIVLLVLLLMLYAIAKIMLPLLTVIVKFFIILSIAGAYITIMAFGALLYKIFFCNFNSQEKDQQNTKRYNNKLHHF